MESVLPMLIIRSDVHALIQVNGRMEGEVRPSGHLALPLSDTGDYYVCAIPLCDSPDGRRYCITRKLSVENGVLTPPQSDDAEVLVWPGGVYELLIRPGLLPAERPHPFPYTLCEFVWQEGRSLRTITPAVSYTHLISPPAKGRS